MTIDSGETYVDEYGRQFDGVEMVDISQKDFTIASTVFFVELMRSKDEVDSSTGSADDGAATTANTSSVVYGDGVVKILTQTLDLNNALNIEALTEKELKAKEAAKAKRQSKEAKEKDDRGE